MDRTEHGVIGMAGVTGLIGGNTVILEVSGWNVRDNEEGKKRNDLALARRSDRGSNHHHQDQQDTGAN